MSEHEERLATLRVELHRRQELYEHATREFYLARAALLEAEGNEFFARWNRALAMKDSETADRCASEWANRAEAQP